MKNLEIREALKDANVKHWQLAEMMGIAESTLCVKLRKELPEEEKNKIMKMIMKKEQ